MSKEIVKKNNEIAFNVQEMDDMFGESALDQSTALSFNTIKIMRESGQFQFAEKDLRDTITGHIIMKHNANQYWKTEFDDRKEGDSPVPNCYSIDGVKPSGGDQVQSEMCVNCPLNQFGSGKDERGKACRNTIRFLFLVDDTVIPVVIAAPPSSLSKKGSVLSWLNSVPNEVATKFSSIGQTNAKGGPIVEYWTAHVELSLNVEKFGTKEASVLKIRTLDVLIPDTEANGAKLRNLHMTVKGAREMYNNERHAMLENDAAAVPEPKSDEVIDVDPMSFTDDNAEIPI